jgi:hypothetical protein
VLADVRPSCNGVTAVGWAAPQIHATPAAAPA